MRAEKNTVMTGQATRRGNRKQFSWYVLLRCSMLSLAIDTPLIDENCVLPRITVLPIRINLAARRPSLKVPNTQTKNTPHDLNLALQRRLKPRASRLLQDCEMRYKKGRFTTIPADYSSAYKYEYLTLLVGLSQLCLGT